MTNSVLRRNIELKARIASPGEARQVAIGLNARPAGILHQIDTYFGCRAGRLKLRETRDAAAELVWYARPDGANAKASDYLLAPVADADLLKATLSKSSGVLVVVEKRRELWLYENVRIHLDDVVGLGAFLEFEAVLQPPFDNAAGERQVAFLCAQFTILPSDLVAASYSDMLLGVRGSADDLPAATT